MKIYLLITYIFIHGLSITTYAQYSSRREKLNVIGLQARLIDLMPFELSYLHLSGKKLPSYALKLGYGKGYKNAVGNAGIYVYPPSDPNFSIDQSFTAYFIKPGIVLYAKKGAILRSACILNYCIAQSKDKMVITSQDQLFGTLQQTYNETNTYQSIELEANHSFYRTSLFELTFGYTAGFKFQNPIPFTTVVNGIENGSTYSPGQGVGRFVYVNLYIGFSVKL
ncbi:MAG: hypothetical protein V4538_05045 [Bacteroidota bacterium]